MSEAVSQQNRLTPVVRKRLFALITVILVSTSVFLSWQSLGLFESSLTPELNKKAQVIGLNAVSDVERAVGLGIPFTELNGVGAYLGEIKKTYPEIEYVAVTDASGALLYKSNDLDIGTSSFFKTKRALDTMGEIFVLAIAALVGLYALGIVGTSAKSLGRPAANTRSDLI